jgi:hypothetical protein
VKPQCTGDAVQFNATMDLTPGWAGFYLRWTRTWDSPAPDRLMIVDDYELERGSAVDFFWMTELDVTVKGRQITVQGKRGKVTIEAQAGTEVRVDDLPFLRGSSTSGTMVTLHRIGIRRADVSGRLTTLIRLDD